MTIKTTPLKHALPFVVTAGLGGIAAWSPVASACSDSPVISSVCIMAAANLGNFNNTYFVANGAVLPISSYQALYSLLGNAYGGDGRTNFALPDLRGRVVVGAGRSSDPKIPPYSVGQTGGQASMSLTLDQLPTHAHAFSGVNVDLSKVTATTTLGTMAAGLTGSLALKASTGGTPANNPADATLATTVNGGPLKNYSDAAPTVAMKAGSIDSSALSVGLTGAPATTLSGTASASGNTALAGGGAAFSIMPPYLAMTYYIAYTGLYPSRD